MMVFFVILYIFNFLSDFSFVCVSKLYIFKYFFLFLDNIYNMFSLT